MSFTIAMCSRPARWPKRWARRLEHHDPGTFHIRLSAMGPLRYAMEFAQVLDDELAFPDFPQWPPEALGLTPKRALALHDHFESGDAVSPPASAVETVARAWFLEAYDEAAATRSPREGQVPGFKFDSNDDWIIDPHECDFIAKGLGSVLSSTYDREFLLELMDIEEEQDAQMVRYLTQWQGFNEVAAKHGGYRVG